MTLQSANLAATRTTLPLHLQVFAGLDNILFRLISLGSNELHSIYYTIVDSAELSAVLPDLRDL
jgi:hypothetical protein